MTTIDLDLQLATSVIDHTLEHADNNLLNELECCHEILIEILTTCEIDPDVESQLEKVLELISNGIESL